MTYHIKGSITKWIANVFLFFLNISKTVKDKMLVLGCLLVSLLQAFFEECVFFGDAPLIVFGISAVRGSWTGLYWTIWAAQSENTVSESQTRAKALENSPVSLAHACSSWHHLQFSDPERRMCLFLLQISWDASVKLNV